ncbi:hypothetical protein PpBr36_07271, partial [Pyricularia pennisetigena]|uniref:hypothetical protein n=1 Tax=Pyricularia pennisetigena TaxID=1578925 RepID=UPI00114F1474
LDSLYQRDGVRLRDTEPQSCPGHRRVQPVDPPVANRGAAHNLLPGTVGQNLKRIPADTLTQGDVLLDCDSLDGCCATHINLDRSGSLAILHGPVSVPVLVQDVTRAKLRIVPGPDTARAHTKLRPEELLAQEPIPQPLELHQGIDICLRDAPCIVGPYVEQQVDAPPDRGHVHIHQLLCGFGLLLCVPKPTGTYPRVRLRRRPVQAVAHADLELPLAVALLVLRPADGVPVGRDGAAVLVADPAGVWALVAPHGGARLVLPDHVPVPRPVEGLYRCGSASSVQPDLEQLDARAVLQFHVDELRQLLHVQLVVVAGAGVTKDLRLFKDGPRQRGLGHGRVAVHVPGGEVDAELEAVPFRRRGCHAHHVGVQPLCPAVLGPLAIGDLVSGRRRVPQRHAVVVLGGQDHAGHAGALERLGPLVRVERRRGENIRRLLASPPLLAGEGVWAKVRKSVVLEPVPAQLPLDCILSTDADVIEVISSQRWQHKIAGRRIVVVV